MKTRLALALTGSILALLAPAYAGTKTIPAQPVTDINTAGDAHPANITFSNYKLYFTATDKGGNTGIYVKSLTKGNLHVADPVLNRKPGRIRNLTKKGVTKVADNFVRAFDVNVADKMFFHVQGEGVYTTKGSAMSTIRLLKFDSLHTTEGFPFDPGIKPYYMGDDKHTMGIVFAGKTAKQGVEPFVSNGKPGAKNTHIVRDINPGVNGSFPYEFLARPSGTAPDQIFFGAYGANFYQLYRTLDGTSANTAEVALVSRTDSGNANLNTFPFGFVLAGSDVVFAAGGNLNNFNREVTLYDTNNNLAYYLTSTGVNPSSFSSGTGSLAYFAGTDPTYGNEPFTASSFSQTAGYRADIVANGGSSLPKDFKLIGSEVYWLANNGTGYHLYRDVSFDSPQKIVSITNADIVVTEYIGVSESTVYFVGDDGSGPTLWQIDNTVATVQATQVKTGQGFVVKNPSHLAEVVNLTGATFINRVYFSCSGIGTEHEGKGEELWVFQP